MYKCNVKIFHGLSELPEVREIINVFLPRNYTIENCDECGLYMHKSSTSVKLVPETDRLRLVIGKGDPDKSERYKALRIAEKIVIKYGYRRGENIIKRSKFEETEDEFYKYF